MSFSTAAHRTTVPEEGCQPETAAAPLGIVTGAALLGTGIVTGVVLLGIGVRYVEFEPAAGTGTIAVVPQGGQAGTALGGQAHGSGGQM